ncbi:MAG TPA: acetate--CoA ligase [Candidatus Bathyarchaeia archaeon]|nr:acetate--CoA ligase [Candidatus Bathyarchaeia archaeon]
MEDKIIEKSKKNLKREPNLANYDDTYKNFHWQNVHNEIVWFSGNKLNAAYNAVDRHAINFRKNKVALYWRDGEGKKEKYTFAEISSLSSQFANVLRELGIRRGDRVFFFLPRVPELYWGFLGVLKRGAIAGSLFAAFGPQALQDRLESSDACLLVTNNELYSRVDQIRSSLPNLKHIILIDGKTKSKTILGLSELIKNSSRDYKVAEMDPAEPAFMLYTSGTTGKPKGVVHAHQAIIQEHMTAKWVLDLTDEDLYWCTADPGWVTGIAYEILGNWSNGASTLIYEGRFDPEEWYALIEEYRVNVWYTAPTAIRMLAAADKRLLHQYDFSSLRHLASVGEPLNPEAIWWGLEAFNLPFHDNWWQTETGGILIANYPCLAIKPGSMGKPFPGVEADIVDDEGNQLPVRKIGNLALRPGWPSMMSKIWRRPQKYQSYFVNNWYISGDLAYKDEDGYFWFVGRSDDVIKTAGERVGPFEVESALISHPAVIEAGVIGKPDPLRGEIIKAFVVLTSTVKPSEVLKTKLQKYVKSHLAGHAYPREIEFVKSLPKTRSGKIVRRFLKAKELGLPVGDTSTLEKF